MIADYANYSLARLSIETKAPLSIGTGGSDGVFDLSLVRDANHLPALPGSSLAGVLRHLYWRQYGEGAMQPLFGYQQAGQGAPSRLQVSWGVMQDSQGQPLEGLLLGEAWQQRKKDILVRSALATENNPIFRDRVCVGHRGVAVDTGKFDRSVLPAGYRFSVEISLWSKEANDPAWAQLLALFQHPLLRLGGGTRAGLGNIELISLHEGCFDLRTATGRKAFAALPSGIGDTHTLEKKTYTNVPAIPGLITARLTLRPLDFWRIGQGDTPHKQSQEGKPADLLPKMEQRVVWKENAAGQWSGKPEAAYLLIPASSIKGALAHRVAFYANCQEKYWAEKCVDIEHYDKSVCSDAVIALFGTARDDNQDDAASACGQVGRVFIDDGHIALAEKELALMMHNVIDRFSGGVREHLLFMEELVWQQTITIDIAIDTAKVSAKACKALRRALSDLCRGRISIGAGGARGHGYCKGSLACDDPAWCINNKEMITEEAV